MSEIVAHLKSELMLVRFSNTWGVWNLNKKMHSDRAYVLSPNCLETLKLLSVWNPCWLILHAYCTKYMYSETPKCGCSGVQISDIHCNKIASFKCWVWILIWVHNIILQNFVLVHTNALQRRTTAATQRSRTRPASCSPLMSPIPWSRKELSSWSVNTSRAWSLTCHVIHIVIRYIVCTFSVQIVQKPN